MTKQQRENALEAVSTSLELLAGALYRAGHEANLQDLIGASTAVRQLKDNLEPLLSERSPQPT